MFGTDRYFFYFALIVIALRLVGTTLRQCPITGNPVCMCNDTPMILVFVALLFHHYLNNDFKSFMFI